MNSEKKGMLAAIAAYSIFGLSFLFSKKALGIVDPVMLLCSRFALTFLLLNILVAARVFKLNLRGKNLLQPILLGLLQPVLYFVLENYGLEYTTTSFTGMLSSLSPIFTALLGVIFLKEKPNAKQWGCIAVSIAGVLMVSLKSSEGTNTLLGCLCLIAAYFSGSFYSLLVRKLSKEYSPFELTYIMFTVGFVVFTGWSFVQYQGETLPILVSAFSRTDFIIAILFLGGASSVGAYMLANYSLAKLPVARSTIFSNFSTIVSVLAGVLIMHDKFTVVSGIAFVLILAGVIGVNYFAPKTAE